MHQPQKALIKGNYKTEKADPNIWNAQSVQLEICPLSANGYGKTSTHNQRSVWPEDSEVSFPH